MTIDYLPSVDYLVGSPLGIFISFAINGYVYSGSAYDIMLEWVYPMFLKSKSVWSIC